MKDIRGQQKAERAYLDRQLQACVVCGRLYAKRRDKVCSMSCLVRYAEQKDPPVASR